MTGFRVVLATHNPHKVEELRAILGPLVPGLTIVAYDGPEAIEDGETFAENALIKARAASAHTGLPAIADDSGISVDALGGAPGIHSARYAGTRDDEDNRMLLLANLRTVQHRAAQFTCAAALVLPSAAAEFVELGIWAGRVLVEPSGTGGFGYDPIFAPAGLTVSAADLTAEQKNAVSHRALAFRALAPILRREVLDDPS